MLETMKELLQTHETCVLATESGGKPHCSLMAYVTDEGCRHVYMVTYKDSIKFRNLEKNPSVSLLVDTRETQGGGRPSETRALTVEGVYEPFQEEREREEVRKRLLAIHPQLKVFLEDPGAEIIAVRVLSFLLLDGLTNAAYAKV